MRLCRMGLPPLEWHKQDSQCYSSFHVLNCKTVHAPTIKLFDVLHFMRPQAGSCASDYRQQMEQSRKGQAFDCPALTAATRQGDSRDEVGRLPGGAPQLSNQPARQKHVPGCSKMTRPWLPSRTLLNREYPHQVVVLAENVRGKALD
jgi:hypothetical protein